MEKENPFTTMFGIQPETMVPRISPTQKVISEFSKKKPSTLIYLVTGIRGSGKTVFLTSISKYFLNQKDWAVIELDPRSKDILRDFAAALYNEKGFMSIFNKAKINLSYLGIGVEIENSNPITDVKIAIKRMMEYLAKKNKKILVSIDETDNTDAMREFVSEYQVLIRRDLPVFLLMTGLPENISLLQNNEALTFLLRAPKIELGPLDFFRMVDVYENKLSLSKETSSEIASLTKGFAYAFQLFGYYTFEMNGDYVSAISNCKLFLFENVYNKIWAKLSKIDKNILYAIVENDSPLSTKSIRELVDMKSNMFSTYRLRLIRRGILAKSEYGYMKFSLPFFDDFIANKRIEEEIDTIYQTI